jgi:hypothetical protein
MPHPKKKQRVTGNDANYLVEAAAIDHLNQVSATANDLSVDVLANSFRVALRKRNHGKKTSL